MQESPKKVPLDPTTYFCRRINAIDLLPGFLEWTGNDDSQRNHNGAIPFQDSSKDIRLSWKPAKNATPRLIGCYRLQLRDLQKAGYIRPDSKPGHVRLRFVHNESGRIQIQVNQSGPALLLD